MNEDEHLLINPCGTASPPHYTLASRRKIPNGAVLGILNNGKANVGEILEQIGDGLIQRFGFSEVLHIQKPAVSHPCPEGSLKELTARCAVVINGVGD
jgi:hypothetical protein